MDRETDHVVATPRRIRFLPSGAAFGYIETGETNLAPPRKAEGFSAPLPPKRVAMKNKSIALVAMSMSLLLFSGACSSGDDGGNNSTKPACTSMPVSGTPQMTCNGANFTVQDASDYTFASEIKLPPVTVKSMANLKVDWSAVTQDFLGHPLSTTADLNSVSLLMWQMPLAQLETKLNADTLSQIDLITSPPPSLPPPNMTLSGTSAQVYDFKVNGYTVNQADYNMYLDPAMYPSSGFSYMAAVATGTDLGQGFRMLQTFNLDAGSSSTTVALKNNSTKLTCEVSLRNLSVTGVPGSTPSLKLDYTALTKNAHGAAFDPSYITSAVVGHYSQTPEELEKQFLDLDLIATDYYRTDITDVGTVDFSTLKDKNNASFPGVDGNGTWLVGLICGNCRNPAPWFMTVLKPCTQ